MTKDEKKSRIEQLKIHAVQLKKDVEYYNAMQTALKLVVFSPMKLHRGENN